MKNTSIILTAGFDKAKNVLSIAELLKRERVEIAGIIVVSPYGLKRVKQLIRQRGKTAIRISLQRMYKMDLIPKDDPIDSFMKYHNISNSSLTDWSRRNSVKKISVKSLNDKRTIRFIKENSPDWVIYGGGGILKEEFITAVNGRILNAHSGPMPEIRGMNACEWSILLGFNPAVTIHFINRGIDTGGILKKIPIVINPGDTIERLRNKCVVEGINGLVDTILNPPLVLPEPDKEAAVHRQCYIMAPALKELLEKRLTK